VAVAAAAAAAAESAVVAVTAAAENSSTSGGETMRCCACAIPTRISSRETERGMPRPCTRLRSQPVRLLVCSLAC
jgi:hypothetical protein